MSNLGPYQKITTWAKKVGGPIQLLCIVATCGFVALRGVEAGGKSIYKRVRKAHSKTKKIDISNAEIFTVEKNGESNEGLKFIIGEKFRVLERDKDAVLIDKIGNPNSPYFVSADFLSSISNFA
ncbi:MAG: hypothetical protein ACOX04_04260 [Candidatus Scatomorpha sp.]|jgi:hypothetical protein